MAKTAVAATVEYLLQDDELVSMLGSEGGAPWLWQDSYQKIVKGTGLVGIYCEPRAGWTVPNYYNTMQFPRIAVMAYGDPDRNSSGQIAAPNGREKADVVLARVWHLLHRPYGDSPWSHEDGTPVFAGAVRVIGSHSMGEPDYLPLSDGDGAVQGTQFFALKLG